MKIYERGSELHFGDFNEANCFHIESSYFYKNLSCKNVKTVEFLLLRPENNTLNFIEAKKTLSNVNNSSDIAKNIKDIAHKFIDSFQLSNAIWFGKHKHTNDLPANYDNFFVKDRVFNFVLVIKERHSNDLRFIKEMIKKEIKKDIIIWKFEVYVLNEFMAKKRKLIISH